ncbi:hypothetical protein FJW03_00765 [Mesorhizobium sp. B4-1-4]|nr:hypothetical protein FJW03_00765 [Mesorhizobium sp. B4-1-4]
MKADDIPAFVAQVIAARCDICAIGHYGYVLGEPRETGAAEDELRRINEEFGDRDYLLPEIVTYLRSLGRYLDPGSPATHWTENRRIQ